VAAGLLITLSDASGPLGLTKEALAVGKAIAESATGGVPEIVKSLAESVKQGGRAELPQLPTGERAQTKEALMETIRSAVRAVETKSPAEAESYKTWLTSVATKVSEASKEGGFLGIGGTRVSTDEQTALDQLSAALGVKAAH
jgi:hypothetical protein